MRDKTLTWWQLAALLSSVCALAYIASFFLRGETEVSVVGLSLVAGFVLTMMTGLALSRRSPRLGSILVAVGAFPIALMMGFGVAPAINVVLSVVTGAGLPWLPLVFAVGGMASVAAVVGVLAVLGRPRRTATT